MKRPDMPSPDRTSIAQEAAEALHDVERFIERGTREFRLTNVALFAAGFSTFALLYCVQPIMPVLGEEFGVGPAVASLSLSVATQCLAVSMLLASSVSEILGRKPVMVASLALSSVLMTAGVLAHDWHTFLLLRALAGIALGGLPAIAMAYVGEEVHTQSLGMAMGLYIGGTGLGALGGRFIVGVLTDLASWRLGMVVVGVLAMASSVVFMVFLPGSRHFVPRPANPTALLKSFAAHLRNPVLVLIFVEGFLLLGVFVSTYNYVGYRLMAPPYGFSQTRVGLVFGLSLIGIVSAAWVGDLASRLSRGRVFWVLVVLMFAGLALTLPDNLGAILAGLALMTFAFYGAHSVASSWVGIQAVQAKAQASSLYLFSYYSGSSVIGFLGGLGWQRGGWNGVVELNAGVLVLAFAGSIALARLTRAR